MHKPLRRRPKKKSRGWRGPLRCLVVVVVVAWVALLALYAKPLEVSVDPVALEEAAILEAAVLEKLEKSEKTSAAKEQEELRKIAKKHGLIDDDDETRGEEEMEAHAEKQQVKIDEQKEEHEAFVMELDERTNLYVPEFYTGETRDDESIFLMIASYRDFQCRDSIISALERAAKPERLVVAAVQQNKEGDQSCLEPEVSCEEDSTQVLCKYKDQLKVYEMDYRDATGPVYARHVGYRMYRGEAFAMQIDAHCVFVNSWDEDILSQWRATKNDMAVLSTYLTDVQGSITPSGDSKRRTRPIMCNSDFEGQPPARYLRHNSQPEAVPVILTEPMLQPFWAAGFSFARGHFLINVKYDCCLPMVFMGEEISIGIRAWTHGYDLYAPQRSVLFHEYAQNSKRRGQVPKFWERGGPDSQAFQRAKQQGNGGRSLKRLTALIGMAPGTTDYDKTLADVYGLGTKRDVQQFYDLFLIDVREKKAQPLCKFVEGGALHRQIHQKYVTPNGIDYSQLEKGFTAQSFIDDQLYEPLANRIRRALTNHADQPQLTKLLQEANRIKLERRGGTYADLVQQARHAQSSLMQHAP